MNLKTVLQFSKYDFRFSKTNVKIDVKKPFRFQQSRYKKVPIY